jgi:amidase
MFAKRGIVALIALGCVACGSSAEQNDASTNDAGTSDAFDEPYNPGDWLDKPLRDQVDAMHGGKLSSAGLAQGYEARIDANDRVDGGTHAVLVVDPAAITNATALDALHDTTALLYGASILVKDNIDSQGIVTTAGSLAMTSNIPPADATVLKKLHDAKGLLLGKTNLSEWANFRGAKSISGWSSYGGQTANGRNTAYNPCGSSSGSASAVASGLASAALGTETNGSITCPSAINGVVGFKPTVGLVSRTGVIPISSTQDTVGPITKTVGDAARIMSAISGPDASDPATSAIPSSMSLDFEAPLSSATLAGKRFGVVTFGFSAQVMSVFNAERARLVTAGATVINVTLDTTSYGNAEFTTLLYEFKSTINAYLGAHPAAGQATLQDLIAYNTAHAATVMPYFGQEVFVQAQATTDLSDPTYLTAKKQAHDGAATNGIDAVMTANTLDALISPTAGVAWPLSTNTDPPISASSGPAAVAGYPHLTVPMGQVNGLPVGMSFFGRAWDDAKILALGYAYEQLPR